LSPAARHLPGIDLSRIPRHVACVMDGNGRWARARGLPRTEGHKAGEKALLDALDGALELGIEWFTVYAFSTENWRRPPEEVRFLLNFNEEILRRHAEELDQKGVRIRFAGRREARIPARVLKNMDEAEERTKANTRMTFTVCFNYGGRAEIVDAARKAIARGLTPEEVNEEAFSELLYWPDMPDPDLVIRTSGEHRISNFLIWQIAYAELVFMEVLWPDFTREHLFEAVRIYQQRERRFGDVQTTE
jgi:undecaprenyl diphosphate synthase